ncbi:WD40 repeat domain-containing protein [Candidatus Chloroploca sp. M-50]|uniref:WD40 repeat domain-containing protein n=1 Tax=Candidatus Chloroploca mongolica TaxID=2528176 RepID=A0ABS4DH77_9CHLR|nr:WD40 repeat domain-containing protein [Candidatus Chloroploca mongolica]MBP1468799.1 WD40 repeat domain-containing protein [Candidatus Chloroploca mongolica]
MTSSLSTDQLTQLIPLLGSLARLLARGSPLSDSELKTLLLGADLESHPAALDELRRWSRLLKALQQIPPDEAQRHATVEALLFRGLPESAVLLAVAMIAGGSAAPAQASVLSPVSSTPSAPTRLTASVSSLDFGSLSSGQQAALEFDVQGGPGQVSVESDQVQVTPAQFGAGVTRLRVELRPLVSGLLWTSLKLVTAGETLEVPVLAQWQDAPAPAQPVPPPQAAVAGPAMSPSQAPPVAHQAAGHEPRAVLASAAPLGVSQPPSTPARRGPGGWIWLLVGLIVVVVVGYGALSLGDGDRPPAAAPTVVPPELAVIAPALSGTAVPQPSVSIGVENADQVVQIARWGEEAVLNEGTVYQWSPQGRWLAVRVASGLRIYNGDTLRLERTLATGRSPTFSPDEQIIASIATDGKTIQLQDALSGQVIDQIQDDQASFADLRFLPNGQVLLYRDDNGTLSAWSVPEHRQLFSIEDSPYPFELSSDGSYLLSRDEELKVWDLRTGEPAEDLAARFAGEQILDVSEDASTLMTLAADGTILARRFPNGATISQFGVFTYTYTDTEELEVMLSPRGNWVVIKQHIIDQPPSRTRLDDNTVSISYGVIDTIVNIWRVTTGEIVISDAEIDQTIPGSANGTSFSASEEFWEANSCEQLALWDLTSQPPTPIRVQESLNEVYQKMSSCSPHNVILHPDGSKVAFGLIGEGGKIAVWNTSDGALINLVDGHTGDSVFMTSFTPDNHLLTIDTSRMRLWNVSQGTVSHEQDFPAGYDVARTRDQLILHASTDYPDFIDTIETFSLESLSEQTSTILSTTEDCFRGVSWSGAPQIAAHATSMVLARECVTERDSSGNSISDQAALAFYLDHTSKPAIFILPHLPGITPYVGSLGPPGGTNVQDMAFSPDGSLLGIVRLQWISTGENTFQGETGLQLVRVPEMELQQTLSPITGTIQRLAFSPDGALLAANTGFALGVWQVSDGTLQQTMRIPDSLQMDGGPLVFSPDGKVLAVIAESKVLLWDVDNGRMLRSLDSPLAASLAFSPDGRLLATGSSEGVVRLWGVKNPTARQEAQSL